jgi:O-Antigen ligase
VGDGTRAASVALAALGLVLPFEPLRPLLQAFGLGFTVLELAAGAAIAVVFASRWREARVLLGRKPLVFLAAFAAANLLSAALAPAYAGLCAKFALRTVAAAAFAVAVAAAPARARRAALLTLAASSVAVALLAIGEGLGLSALDPLLGLFRERGFRVGDLPRASGGSSGPNQAAAFLTAGLVAGVALLRGRARPAFAALLALGLLYTYSRGGLVAAATGLLVLGWAWREQRRTVLACAGVLAVLALAFLAQPTFRARVATEMVERAYQAGYRPADASLRLAAGETRTLDVELTNIGPSTFLPSERTTLHAFLYEWPAREPLAVWRRALPSPVPPGHVERLSLAVQAPDRAGAYVLVFDLFTLPSGFLSASGVPPALVPVGVDFEPPEAVALPGSTWRRGRVELWRLAIAMWRDRPLLGVGPDNFRRLHPVYGGWLGAGNFPMSAHNQLLETASTTGSLGLLALLGTIAFSARAALAARAGPDAALASVVLALLAAFVVQAQVDALLEFTGHYLLFALVVGTAAALRERTLVETVTPPAGHKTPSS